MTIYSGNANGVSRIFIPVMYLDAQVSHFFRVGFSKEAINIF